MEEKIEITFQPIKKIVIFECAEFSTKELFRRVELMARSGHSFALNWAEGIVFLAMPYHPESDAMIEQVLKGTMYLASVMFSCMHSHPSSPFQLKNLPYILELAYNCMHASCLHYNFPFIFFDNFLKTPTE